MPKKVEEGWDSIYTVESALREMFGYIEHGLKYGECTHFRINQVELLTYN